MRVRLKGLNRVQKRLADGRLVTYHYAWKGGPRLPGKPGSPEFIAAYNEAIVQKLPPKVATLSAIFDAYESSAEFDGLAPRTKHDYRIHLRALSAKFGTFPLTALPDPRTRGIFLAHRDEVARSGKRLADYRFATFARILAWAADRGMIAANPLKRPGRVYRSQRRDSVWAAEDEAKFRASAPAHLHLALSLALWTGQRLGDLLALRWRQYDGAFITLEQGKTGARLRVPVLSPLKAELDSEMARQAAVAGGTLDTGSHVLLTTAGTPWTGQGFQASWRKAVAKAKVSGLTFHDLRGTAVTRFVLHGLTVPEVVAFTGHSLADANEILQRHYLARDPKIAESARAKLENVVGKTQLDSQPATEVQ